jgi:hypothetical protein
MRVVKNVRAVILFTVVVLAIGCSCATAQVVSSARDKLPYTITLTPDRIVVKTGATVWVQVSIKNLQDQPMQVIGGFTPYALTGLDNSYDLRCTDSFGKVVPKEILQVGSAHDGIELGPGKTRELLVDLNRVCDLQKVGAYHAMLSRKSLMHPKDPVIASNTISVEVTN